jgi:hypothetical protein
MLYDRLAIALHDAAHGAAWNEGGDMRTKAFERALQLRDKVIISVRWLVRLDTASGSTQLALAVGLPCALLASGLAYAAYRVFISGWQLAF